MSISRLRFCIASFFCVGILIQIGVSSEVIGQVCLVAIAGCGYLMASGILYKDVSKDTMKSSAHAFFSVVFVYVAHQILFTLMAPNGVISATMYIVSFVMFVISSVHEKREASSKV